jgi:O-antigen/teichoic acid export membrane protein
MNQFGYFSAGAVLANRLTALPDGLCTATYPGMANACAAGPQHGRPLVLKYLLIAACGSVAVAAAAFFAAGPLGRILFPSQPVLFVEIARITVWSLPLMAVELVIGNALNAAGKDSAQARASLPAAAIALLGAVLLVSTMGLTGACWSMLLRPLVRSVFLAPIMVRTFRTARAGSPSDVDAASARSTPLLRKAS